MEFLAVAVVWLFISPIFGVLAFFHVRGLKRSVAELRREVAALRQPQDRDAGVQPAPVAGRGDPVSPGPEPLSVDRTYGVEASPQPTATTARPTPVDRNDAQEAFASAWSWEDMVGRRWLVWIGGISLALGGGFLVKMAADMGMFGPAVRCVAAAVFGFGLVVGSLWLARRSPQAGAVPGAMAGSGLFTMMAATYAAFELYALLPPLIAFAVMAFVALAGFALALLLGRIPAVIGIVGALAVPILVSADDPDAIALYAYLLLPLAAGLWVVRHRAWVGVGWFLLVTLSVWLLAAPFLDAATIPAASFMVVASLLWLIACRIPGLDGDPSVRAAKGTVRPHRLAIGSSSVMGLGLLWLIGQTGGTLQVMPFVGVYAAILLALARLTGPWASLVPVAGAVSVAAVAMVEGEGWEILVAAVGLGSLHAVGSVIALARSWHPAWWAWSGAATPLAIAATAYQRSPESLSDLAWGGVALALAALATEATRQAYQRVGSDPAMRQGVGAGAACTMGALGLGAAFTLAQSELPLALAGIVAGAGWVYGRLVIGSLRYAAMVVSWFLLVTFVLVPFGDRLLYSIQGYLTVVTTYLIPAALLIYGARRFAPGAGMVPPLLEAVGLGHWVMGIAIALRLFVVGDAEAPVSSVAEVGAHATSWLAMAAVLARLAPRLVIARRAADLLGLLGGLALLGLMVGNPVVTGEPIGVTALFNPLLVGYLLPALSAALYAAQYDRHRLRSRTGLVAAVLLLFLWVNFEIRRSFAGSVLSEGDVGDFEGWIYSLVWVLYGAVLLAVGIGLKRAWLRQIGLAFVVTAIGKTFILDMADLEGVWRATSFMALGAVILAVAWAYQHLIKAVDGQEDNGRDNRPLP